MHVVICNFRKGERLLRRFLSVYFSTIINCQDCLNPFLLIHKNWQLNFIATIFCDIIVHFTFGKVVFLFRKRSAKSEKSPQNWIPPRNLTK